jgi:prepilin signal peptidase PulO-like enzyme (type II secretory pathway)
MSPIIANAVQESVLWELWALILGAILASFINALSFRLHTGRSVLRGRSRCMRCNHTLHAVDLIPIFSYLWLGGRCRYCRARISAQYILVEAVGAILSLGVYLTHLSLASYAFWLLVWMVILLIVVYDLRHFIIPWSASVLLILLALVHLSIPLLFHGGSLAGEWPTLIAGPSLALPLFLLSLVSWGRWMGWADSVFELSLGWLLGLGVGATALMLAVWSGAAVGLLLIGYTHLPGRSHATGRTMNMRSEVPFAPFLALGAMIAYFYHVDFFSALPLLF